MNEMAPTRPINIINIMSDFDKFESMPVIPVVKPTVAKAETVSKIMSKMEMLLVASTIAMIAVTIETKKNANIVSEKALYTVNFSTLCLKMTVSSYPLMTLRSVAKITTSVVVLIPPPVDADDAPMNIKITVKSFVSVFSCPIGTEKNPAVLTTVA